VPDTRKHGKGNAFPRFETYQKKFEGHSLLPTYNRADATLHFQLG
jgi:hypothetical protein